MTVFITSHMDALCTELFDSVDRRIQEKLGGLVLNAST